MQKLGGWIAECIENVIQDRTQDALKHGWREWEVVTRISHFGSLDKESLVALYLSIGRMSKT
jgi:hypothetical protein